MIFISEDLRLRAPLCKACLWVQTHRGWIQGAVWADLKEPGDDGAGTGAMMQHRGLSAGASKEGGQPTSRSSWLGGCAQG